MMVNWRSTAIVSGLGVLATWLASGPAPVTRPATAAAPTTLTRPTTPEIQALAVRLQSQVHFVQRETGAATGRNPFAFSAARSTGPRVTSSAGPVEAIPEEPRLATAPPSAPTLSGIAMDVIDGREVRTAILRTTDGLVLAHEGDILPGSWQVERIGEESVALVRPDDGSSLQVGFRP